jgi:GT2 family glycosyltransferase
VEDAPDLSILIVNWNGKEMVRDLLRSIDTAGDGLKLQSIVVDNASTDGAPEAIAAEFPNVVLQRNPVNLGFSRGNNKAASFANAPLLLLLNNDTRVCPGALRTLVKFMEGHPEAVAAGPRLLGADGKTQSSGRNLPTLAALLNSIQFIKLTGLCKSAYREYRNKGFAPTQPEPIGQLAAAALVIRRDAFAKSGGFDEKYLFGVEDVDLCRRLGELGKIFYVPDAKIEHLGRISSRANREMVYRAYECGWARYLGKHHGTGAALLYKMLVTLDMPVRLGVMASRYVWQTFRRETQKQARTGPLLKAAFDFTLRGLPEFWRS